MQLSINGQKIDFEHLCQLKKTWYNFWLHSLKNTCSTTFFVVLKYFIWHLNQFFIIIFSCQINFFYFHNNLTQFW